jgi:hypothetical protein
MSMPLHLTSAAREMANMEMKALVAAYLRRCPGGSGWQ